MLTQADFQKVINAALAVVVERGADYYSWVNAPEADANGEVTHDGDKVTASQALNIYKRKLDGAYGEHFIMSLGLSSAIIANGYNVRVVQFQNEPGVPFDSSGCITIVVETMPIFHVLPDDLHLEDVSDIVEILLNNQAEDVCWKKTNKVGEFQSLLAGASQSELNLVSIAKKNSK